MFRHRCWRHTENLEIDAAAILFPIAITGGVQATTATKFDLGFLGRAGTFRAIAIRGER